MLGSRSMTHPIAPVFFIGVFLLVVIAAVLMLAQVIGRGGGGEGDAATPRAALARQLVLLKEGDCRALKPTFVEGLRAEVTEELVQRRKAAYQDVTLQALVGGIAVGTRDGVQEAQVSTPDGKPFTRLVFVDGAWLADSIWFAAER